MACYNYSVHKGGRGVEFTPSAHLFLSCQEHRYVSPMKFLLPLFQVFLLSVTSPSWTSSRRSAQSGDNWEFVWGGAWVTWITTSGRKCWTTSSAACECLTAGSTVAAPLSTLSAGRVCTTSYVLLIIRARQKT